MKRSIFFSACLIACSALSIALSPISFAAIVTDHGAGISGVAGDPTNYHEIYTTSTTLGYNVDGHGTSQLIFSVSSTLTGAYGISIDTASELNTSTPMVQTRACPSGCTPHYPLLTTFPGDAWVTASTTNGLLIQDGGSSTSSAWAIFDPTGSSTYTISAGTYQALFIFDDPAMFATSDVPVTMGIWAPGGGPVTSSTIELFIPFDGETLPEQQYWVVGWANSDLTGDGIFVLFSMDSSTIPANPVGGHSAAAGAFVESSSLRPLSSADPLRIYHDWINHPMTSSTPTTWYAQALITNSSSMVLANGGTISFTIDQNAFVPTSTYAGLGHPYNVGGLGPGYVMPPCLGATGGFFTDPIGSIKDAFCLMFIPSQSQQADLGDTLTLMGAKVGHKPPFGYFASFSDRIAAIQNSTSSTSTPLLDATSSAALAPAFNQLDVGLALIIWLLFAVWGFHRARLIEL